MNVAKYVRKPFEVEAIQVTPYNLEEVAEWCLGELKDDTTRPFIKVDVQNPLTERQTKAYPGDWVLKAATGCKVYSNRAFVECFIPSTPAVKAG